ncbi:uncharacterized protein LOC118428535 [Branchiostoma floridae]|uniref:Uncharacterized protein LOC118428535 n=1 Tax=Branchiostoma floridae TaxID=7739 RepID=A0A9J7N995_BRAFL|nr:uncharacterized protein LOC118428535 [Branchiostoma floridae]
MHTQLCICNQSKVFLRHLSFFLITITVDLFCSLLFSSLDIPREGTNLRTQPGSLPTVGAILRLITTERPDGIIAAASPELLPSLDSLVDGGYHRPISPRFVPPTPADEMLDGLDDVETGPSWRRKTKPRKRNVFALHASSDDEGRGVNR